MIKGVIFDMDGVLIDNRQAHFTAFEIWCKPHAITVPTDFLDRFSGMGNDDIFPALMGDPTMSKADIDRYAAQKEEIYRDIMESTIAPTAGLVDLLEELQKQGVKMAVGSSAMRINVDFVLDRCGIAKYFSAIADGEQVKKAKPAPDIFLLAAKKLGLAPSECFVFEDAFVGVEAARAAGMPVGVLATTFRRDQHTDFDFLIDDFTQIAFANSQFTIVNEQ